MKTCDLCDKPAVYHDVRIVNNIPNTVHLCKECAVESGLDIAQNDYSVVLKIQGNSPAQLKSCPDCGMTISDYKKATLLGCPKCYETFSNELEGVIKRVQNNKIEHLGRCPSQLGESTERELLIRNLLRELNDAVQSEAYERAAVIRDQLKSLHDEKND